MNSVNTNLKCCSFTFFTNKVFNLFRSFFNHLLDSCRMNTSIHDKLFQSNTCNFSSYRIKSR